LVTLKDKIALVTGGAAGLGKAIVKRLSLDGATVVITDIQTSLGETVASELDCEFLSHDVTDEAQWTQVMRQVQQRHGGLHILVNNAGISGAADAVNPETTRLEDWRRVFAANVESVFLGCRAAIPVIDASGGGSIVNVASIAGLLATPYATAYGASKAAVRQLTKTVAQHCMEHRLNVRCNSVHPGPMRTPLWESQAAEAARKRGVSIETIVDEIEALIPMGDFTQLQDVAAAVAFLASAESRHMTGAKLVVDGGMVHCDTYRKGVVASRRVMEAQ